MKKGQFANKGKAILGERPSGIGEVLDDDAPSPTPSETVKQADAGSNQPARTPKSNMRDTKPERTDPALNEGVRETVNTVVRKTEKPDPEELPPQREEFRFPGTLAERLRTYCFNTRTKKTAIVIEALDEYLKDKGY